MRAGRLIGSSVGIVDREPPQPDDRHVVVDVATAGICGSDLHMVHDGLAATTLGHEFSGRIAGGPLVAIRPTGMCGSCEQCAQGRTNLCAQAFGSFLGGVLDGGWADQVAVDSTMVFPLPHGTTPGAGALVEPLAVAIHGVRRVELVPGQRVAVIGGGSVGLAVVAAAMHLGYTVDIDARYDHQRRAADALGAHVGLRGRHDVVFDAVGSQSAVEASLRACRSGGSIVELGVFWEPVVLTRELTLREITLIPSMFYAHDHTESDFDTAISVISLRPEIESILVTHRFPLDDVAEAMRVADDRSAGAIKVHLVVSD